MKIQNLVAVAAIGLTASTAFAQSHPSAPGIASSTVSSIFVPRAAGPSGVSSGGAIVSAPASTPVSVPPSAATAAAAPVTTGAPAAVAAFTQSLGAAGVPAVAAQGIATALQQLSASPTVGSIAAAVTSWNATIATLSPTQVHALLRSPAGRAAMHTMIRASIFARTAR